MQIEWKVGAVERDVALDESRHAPMRAPSERLQPTPEQAVVDQQQVGPLLRRQAHGRLAQIDRRCHTAHGPRVRDLKSVHRVGRVRYFGDSEVAIQIGDQRGELDSRLSRLAIWRHYLTRLSTVTRDSLTQCRTKHCDIWR